METPARRQARRRDRRPERRPTGRCRRAVALAQSAADGVEAPAALRARVEAQRRVRRTRVSSRPALIGAAAATVAAVAAEVVLLGSGSLGRALPRHRSATELQPRARGDATLVKTSSGWRIELDASRLQRLAGGHFYEAWLGNSAGVLVPVGTFNVGRKVTPWAWVSPKSFEIIRTPFRAPKANAFAERWVGTVPRDCLDRLLIGSRRQLERVLRIYVDHHNTHRPHHALGLTAPIPGSRLRLVGPGTPGQVDRRDRLGGLIPNTAEQHDG